MNRQKRVERAQLRILFTCPFFAPGVAKLPVIFDDTVPTACTNGEHIRFGTAFFDKLTDGEIVTVLAHEVGHCMFGHCWRAPSGAEPDTWNIAVDHHVNTMLKDFTEQVMARRLADPFPFPEGKYCCDPQYRDMSEELTYHKLLSQKPPGGSGCSQGKGGVGKVAGRGNSAPNSGFGEVEIVKNGNSAKAKQLQNDWTATLLQSAQMAQGRGELPASMSRLVDSLVKPQVPWPEILRSWLREQCADDWSWTRPELSYEGSGFILPALYSERMSRVVFCIDTSGSIDGPLLRQFKSEIQNCLDEMRPASLTEICCDAAIQREIEYSVGDSVRLDAPGGGGTSFIPALTRCEQMNPAPKAVVYLTDGDGDYGKEPPFPVIWVMYGGRKTAPYGEIVQASPTV